jgi:hypothetical protein
VKKDLDEGFLPRAFARMNEGTRHLAQKTARAELSVEKEDV